MSARQMLSHEAYELHTSPNSYRLGFIAAVVAADADAFLFLFCFSFNESLAFDPLNHSKHKRQIDLVIGWQPAPLLAPRA